MKKIMSFVALIVFLGLLSGCAPNVSPHTYEASEAGVASKVLSGVIIGKRAVKVDANSGVGGLAGAGAGAGAGAVGGSAIGGSSRSNAAGAIGGAVIGGLVGNAIEKAVHSHKAFEYIIKMNNGSTISIAQAQDLEFEVGQPVLVIYGAKTRILPDNTIFRVEKAKK